MKKTKSVAFNLSDPYEKRLHDHAGYHNVFSAYVKRLIQRDMEEEKENSENNKHARPTTKGIKMDLR